MTTTLLLLRHGETNLNAAGIFQGQIDEPLNAKGLAQAAEAAVSVASHRPDVLYASNLVRARQTAGEIAKLTSLPVHTDARLSEIDCGSWSGQTFTKVREENPDCMAAIQAGLDFRRSPTGETEAEVADRVGAALEDIIARHEGQTIAVAGHGLAIRVGVARILGLPASLAPTLGTMHNCHYALVMRSGARTRLAAYNIPG